MHKGPKITNENQRFNSVNVRNFILKMSLYCHKTIHSLEFGGWVFCDAVLPYPGNTCKKVTFEGNQSDLREIRRIEGNQTVA